MAATSLAQAAGPAFIVSGSPVVWYVKKDQPRSKTDTAWHFGPSNTWSLPLWTAASAGLVTGLVSQRRCQRQILRAMDPQEFGLPSQLAKDAKALSSLPNERLRSQQLLAFAAKLPAMPPALKTDANKVPGCLSTVHVHATLNSDGTVIFQGDADALIPKGLVALLVRGLSGSTVEEIAVVQPEFIKACGITASLTPGRNNGFYNMFKMMKHKAAKLGDARREVLADEESVPEPAQQLQIYNTMTRKKEAFTTLADKEVKMYVCGVTVYDLCHLGHARIMVFFDMVARYLKYSGYKVTYVRNVTDIDDKIIKRSAEAQEDAQALARRMESEMQEDAAKLGCVAPSHEPRVSDHIDDIVSMVDTLIQKGHAYSGSSQGAGGLNVNFRVRSFSPYGRLSGVKLDGNRAGARVEVDSEKEAPEDFALWKAAKSGEPSWQSPWGLGRPGWHIECSAMAKHHLGDTLDIHGGGPDLIFPHHENEIAQSEAANGAPYATTWMHCAAVRSTGEEKMSKSLGNFVTIRDALSRHSGETLRFYLLSSQYRQPLLYSEEAILQAHERLLRLYSSLRGVDVGNLSSVAARPGSKEWDRFHAAMTNDFDTVTAISVMNELAREILRLRQAESDDAPSCVAIAQELCAMGALLGVLQDDPETVLRGQAASDEGFTARVDGLIKERTEARASKNWARADEIRQELTDLGVVIEDGTSGTTWRVGALVS